LRANSSDFHCSASVRSFTWRPVGLPCLLNDALKKSLLVSGEIARRNQTVCA